MHGSSLFRVGKLTSCN